jgi:predicted nuclease of predicted toxin-antitoxin system
MRFKIDENLPIETAHLLQRAGHDAMTVADQQMSGQVDSNIARVCQTEHRVLITLDIDFADIRTYPPSNYPGLIVLRLDRQDKPHVLDVIRRLIASFENEPLDQRLWIVEEARIRIRG